MGSGQELTATIVFMGLSMPLWVAKLLVLAAALVAALIVDRVVTRALRKVLDKAEVPSASIIINVVRAVVWSVAFLSILKPVFDIEPTGFIAALGVGSIALTLGLQDTIANLFGGLSLMLGKVIVPGDVITVGSTTGEVTDITFRSTTVRQFNNNLHVIPNSVLSKTQLTKLTGFSAGEYLLPVMLVKDFDYEQVSAEIDELAKEALGEFYDDEYGTVLFISEFNNFGVLANISLHAKAGISPGMAITAMSKQIVGKSWLV